MVVRRINRIRDVLRARFPESRLEKLTDQELAALKRRHANVPVDLLEFFKIVGCGSIGRSQYMIYDLIDAIEIFSGGNAAELDGIVLIGDDFAGQHEAYDTKNEWRFGTVGGSARFRPHTNYRDFLEFIERWFVEEEVG